MDYRKSPREAITKAISEMSEKELATLQASLNKPIAGKRLIEYDPVDLAYITELVNPPSKSEENDEPHIEVKVEESPEVSENKNLEKVLGVIGRIIPQKSSLYQTKTPSKETYGGFISRGNITVFHQPWVKMELNQGVEKDIEKICQAYGVTLEEIRKNGILSGDKFLRQLLSEETQKHLEEADTKIVYDIVNNKNKISWEIVTDACTKKQALGHYRVISQQLGISWDINKEVETVQESRDQFQTSVDVAINFLEELCREGISQNYLKDSLRSFKDLCKAYKFDWDAAREKYLKERFKQEQVTRDIQKKYA